MPEEPNKASVIGKAAVMAALLFFAVCGGGAAAASAQPPHGRGMGPFPGDELLRPLPEDEGPLEPGEQEALTEFAARHVPFIHRALHRVQRFSPQAYQERLERVAPRLRRLQRIFERNTQLGEKIVRYAENQQRIHHARRAWTDGEPPPVMRRRLMQEIRPLLAENLRIEMAVLEDRVEELTQTREERIELLLARMTDETLDLAAVPDEARELLQRYREAEAESEQEALLEELRRLAAERIDGEIEVLHHRIEHLRVDAPNEVDRRIERVMQGFRETPPPGRGWRDGERRPDRRPRRP